MSPFERAVLRITLESSEAIGWYQIERRLSNMAFDERPYLPDVLAELIARGWISEVHDADEPRIRYVVTKLG
jgi:hypothetical protein